MLEKIKRHLDEGTLELFKHGKNYVSSAFLVKGLSIISIPILTRLLVPADYGILAVFSSFVTIVSIVFGLGFKGAVSRYYYESTGHFNSFISANILFVWGGSFILALITIFYRAELAVLLNVPVSVVVFGTITAYFATTYEIVYAYLQADKQSKLIAKISVYRAAMTLTVTIILTIYLTHDKFLGQIYSQTIFSVVFFGYSLWLIKDIFIIEIHRSHIKYSLLFGLPIVLHLLSGYVLNNFDQIMISNMLGNSDTGLYSFAYKVGMLFQLFIIGLNRSWVPLFYGKVKEGKHQEIFVTSKKYSVLVSLVAVLLVVFSPILVKILADRKYYTALPVVPVIILGFLFVFLYTIYANYSFYYKKTLNIALFTILAGSINIGLNYWLLPIYGYPVAAWTTVIGYFSLFLFHYINVRFILKIKNSIPLKIVLPPVILSIFVILIYLKFVL